MGVLAEFEAVARPQTALEIFAGRSAKERAPSAMPSWPTSPK
jgi:hypothetical protein